MNKTKETAPTPRIGSAGYVLEGLYNWIFAMRGAPHIAIVADWPGNVLPGGLPIQAQELVTDDGTPAIKLNTIILNIGMEAVRGVKFYRGDDSISEKDPVTHLLFSGRARGLHFDATIDVNSILSIFMLEESGRGMSLGNNPALDEYMTNLVAGTPAEELSRVTPKPKSKPTLSVVK